MNKLTDEKIRNIINAYQEGTDYTQELLLWGRISLYGWSNRMSSGFLTMSTDIRTVYEYGDMTPTEYMDLLTRITDNHTKMMRKRFLEYKKKFG